MSYGLLKPLGTGNVPIIGKASDCCGEQPTYLITYYPMRFKLLCQQCKKTVRSFDQLNCVWLWEKLTAT